MNIVVLFADGHMLTENFPIKLIRGTHLISRLNYCRETMTGTWSLCISLTHHISSRTYSLTHIHTRTHSHARAHIYPPVHTRSHSLSLSHSDTRARTLHARTYTCEERERPPRTRILTHSDRNGGALTHAHIGIHMHTHPFVAHKDTHTHYVMHLRPRTRRQKRTCTPRHSHTSFQIHPCPNTHTLTRTT